jgi:hypothetical protein
VKTPWFLRAAPQGRPLRGLAVIPKQTYVSEDWIKKVQLSGNKAAMEKNQAHP